MARLTDREFIERAVVAGFISEAQAEECMELARRLKSKAGAIPVRQVLLDKGYLTEAQVRSVRYGGSVITLRCEVCGKTCRLRGRRSKESRKCPQCGGALQEFSPDDAAEPGEDAQPAAAPTQQEPAAADAAAPTTPAAEPPAESLPADAPAAEPGKPSETAAEKPAEPPRPAKPSLPPPRPPRWYADPRVVRAALIAALTPLCALALRGVLMLIGVR